MSKKFTVKQQKLADKITQAYPVDERVSAVNDKGLAACGIIAIFYVIGRIIYVGIKGDLALPELILLFVMVAAITFVNGKNHVYNIPTTILSRRPLDTEPTKKAKKKRLLYYLGDSAIFATAMSAFTFIFEKDSRHFTEIITEFVICFIISYVFDYFLEERKVKKYNEYMKTLDDEENDDE